MHILITGGAGFIGSHLVHFHLRRGDTVEIVDDLSTGCAQNLFSIPEWEGVAFHQANLQEWQGLRAAVLRADRIYHMAAVAGRFRVLKEPLSLLQANITATDRLLDAASRSPRKPQVVIASSASVYGMLPAERMQEDASISLTPGMPLCNEMLAKLANEAQARAYHQECGLRVVIARLFNIIGPRQSALHGAVVPRMVQQALSQSPMTVFGNGTQTRAFCDVRDTVAMLHTLASNPKCHGMPVNVGNAQEVSILDLAQRIKALVGSSSPIEFIPFDKAYGQNFAQVEHRRPVLARLQSLTGYRHQWTLDQSIVGLCDHYARLAVPVPEAAPEVVEEQFDDLDLPMPLPALLGQASAVRVGVSA